MGPEIGRSHIIRIAPNRGVRYAISPPMTHRATGTSQQSSTPDPLRGSVATQELHHPVHIGSGIDTGPRLLFRQGHVDPLSMPEYP